MKTLHPADKMYRPKYINNDDGSDYNVAHGFCYHNVHPDASHIVGTGVGLACWLFHASTAAVRQVRVDCGHGRVHFAVLSRDRKMMRLLEGLKKHLLASPWMSLPELTDAHGQENPFGCPAQAWSVGTIMDAVYDFSEEITKKHD